MKIISYLTRVGCAVGFALCLTWAANAGWQTYQVDFFDDGTYMRYSLGTGDQDGLLMAIHFSEDGEALKVDAWAIRPNPEDPSGGGGGGGGDTDPKGSIVAAIMKDVSRPIFTMTFEESPVGEKVVRIIPNLGQVYIPDPTGESEHRDTLDTSPDGSGPKFEPVTDEEIAKLLEFLAENYEELIDPNGGSVRDQLALLIGNVEGGTIELVTPKVTGPGPVAPEELPAKKSDDALEREAADPYDGMVGPPELINPDPTARDGMRATDGAAELDAEMGALPELVLTAPGSSAPTGLEAGAVAGSTGPSAVTTASEAGGGEVDSNLAPTSGDGPAATDVVPLGKPRADTVPQDAPNLNETLR